MENEQPLSHKTVLRILIGALIIVSLYAGYYHSAVIQERKNYQILEAEYENSNKQ